MSHSTHRDGDGEREPSTSTVTTLLDAAHAPTSARAGDPRARIFDALIATVAYRGYDRTTVTRVLQTADVPAAVFEEHFRDKEDCFLQALDVMIGEVERRVFEQFGRSAPWAERVRLGLTALLAALASDPEAARVAMVECLGAGAAANARYQAVVRLFVPLIEEGRLQAAFPEQLPQQTSEAVVGGIASILHRRVLEERTGELPGLLPDLLYFALVPYLGHHRALSISRSRAGTGSSGR